MIKEFTGGDPIRARRMREDPWEFLPTHKILLCTNHRPRVKGTDHAIWRRLRLIPFNVTFADDQQDKSLPQKLRRELPGILAWCVAGFDDWRAAGGLNPPVEVIRATAHYRKDEDVVEGFLDEECVRGAGLEERATPLYQRYRGWAEACGETPITQHRFGGAMTEKGFERGTNNGTVYKGLKLRPEPEPEKDVDGEQIK
jgi:putative DNA primase/helicase